MEVEDYAAVGRCINFVLVPATWLFIWRQYPERMSTYAFMCSFALCSSCWQQRLIAAYTAHIKTYGQPPPDCQQGYKFPWRSVSNDSSKECEAYRLAISSAPSPEVDPFYPFLRGVSEAVVIFLGELGAIGKLVIAFAFVPLANRVLLRILVRRAEQLPTT